MLIRLLNDGRLEWLDSAARTVRRASFDDWRERNGDVDSVSLLVPGEDVLVTEVQIAARQRHKLMQALPYAVEDQLVEEVDRYHFALGPAVDGDRYLAAAVLRDRLDGWLSPFADAGIRVTSVTADAQVLPAPADAAVLVFDEDRALLRAGPADVYAISTGEIETFLTLAQRPKGTAYGQPPEAIDLPDGWERRETSQPALPLLERWHKESGDLIELRQGAYTAGDPRRRRGRRIWSWAAALLVLALLLETAVRAVDFYQGSRRLNALQTEAEGLLRQTFPDIQRVVDPRLQMAQRLRERRGRVADSGAGLLYLLRLAGPGLVANPEVRIESLTYRSGELVVEVRSEDLARIEALRQQLSERQVSARIESATTLEDQATARIRIGSEA